MCLCQCWWPPATLTGMQSKGLCISTLISLWILSHHQKISLFIASEKCSVPKWGMGLYVALVIGAYCWHVCTGRCLAQAIYLLALRFWFTLCFESVRFLIIIGPMHCYIEFIRNWDTLVQCVITLLSRDQEQ